MARLLKKNSQSLECGFWNLQIKMKRHRKTDKEIKKNLKNADGLNFSGEPMSDEAIQSLLEAPETAVRQTHWINKKYIPETHRKDEKQ
jgi:hypothetical protein